VAARAFDEGAVAHHEAAAQQGVDRQALHLAAVPRVIFARDMKLGIVDRGFACEVHDRDVGLGAGRDDALARIEAPDLGGLRGRDRDSSP